MTLTPPRLVANVGLILLLFSAGATARAGEIAWGEPVDGVRLGLQWDSSSAENSLAISFENIGTAPRNLFLLSDQTGAFEFSVTTPDGTIYRALDRMLYVPTAGLLPVPELLHLEPGGVHTFRFPAGRFLFVPAPSERDKRQTTLDSFLRNESAARALFRLRPDDWKWTKLIPRSPWIGSLASGEIKRSATPK